MIANDISPIALTAVRFGLAACIIGLVAFFTGKITKSAMQSSWRYFILGGTFSLYFVLMFEGLRSATPISAAAVFTLMPAMSSLLGFIILKQKLVIWPGSDYYWNHWIFMGCFSSRHACFSRI